MRAKAMNLSSKQSFEIVDKHEVPSKLDGYKGRWVSLLKALSKLKDSEALKVPMKNYNEVTHLKKVVIKQFTKRKASFSSKKNGNGIDFYISFEGKSDLNVIDIKAK